MEKWDSRAVIVVPCYDEALRLDPEAFLAACRAQPGLSLLFVDDGSQDATLPILRRLAACTPQRIDVLPLPANGGKAEAVRAGLLAALGRGADYVGWWDADLSTPLDEIPRFLDVLERNPGCELVIGSRIRILGSAIERSVLRHLAGRAFAAAASHALRVAIYDTQCGAKLLRRTPQLETLLAEPFTSGWAFDVELLARLLQQRRARPGVPAAEVVIELPVSVWRDVRGSKVRPWDFPRALFTLWRIGARYRDRSPRAPEDP